MPGSRPIRTAWGTYLFAVKATSHTKRISEHEELEKQKSQIWASSLIMNSKSWHPCPARNKNFAWRIAFWSWEQPGNEGGAWDALGRARGHELGLGMCGRGQQCHGLSPNSPWSSEASPPPPTAQPISQPFRLASNPPGLSTYFSFPHTDSHMTLVCSHYLSLLDTLDSPCLHFDLQHSALTWLHDLTFRLCPWQLYSHWHSGNSSAWSLRITTVSGMFPCHLFSMYML